MTKAKAAVLERSRRSTAGKRMSSLVGKAQENDDAFWSHSIWSEAGGGFADGRRSRKRRRDGDGGSSSSTSSGSVGGSGDDDEEESDESDGEGSYRMSDEDPDAAVDKFDSDFDDSESEDEDDGDGEVEEEQDLRAEERREAASRRRKNQRLGVPPKSSAGRELLKKKTGRVTKRGPLGEGWNEGLVLNWPPPPGGTAPPVAKPAHAQTLNSKPTTALSAQGSTSIPAAPTSRPQHVPSKHVIDPTQPSKLRFPPSPKRNLRTATTSTTAPSAKPTPKRQTEKKAGSKRRQFTQEELILESIKSTETENAKWLSSRKRDKDEAARSEEAASAGGSKNSSSQKVSRFHSRRGCCNTLTFMDMDRLPEILTQRRAASSPGSGGSGGASHHHGGSSSSRRRRADSVASEAGATAQKAPYHNRPKCAVTGKVARYKDPKTSLCYHDIDAYKEIRRRFEAGELTLSQPARDRTRKFSGSNIRVSARRNFSNSTTRWSKTHFPFAVDQPTMVAETKPNGPELRVMVTQGGIPVSPPPSADMPSEYLGRPLPSSGNALRQRDNRKELPLLPPLVASKHNGHEKAAIGNHGERKAGAAERVTSNPPRLFSKLQGRHCRSGQPIEQAWASAANSVGNDDDDNRKVDRAQPDMAVSVSPGAAVAAATPGTEGKVKTFKRGPGKRDGSPPMAKEVLRNGAADDGKEIAQERTTPNDEQTTEEGNKEKATSPPPMKDAPRNSATDGDEGVVPDRTTSNGKRTTIEAN